MAPAKAPRKDENMKEKELIDFVVNELNNGNKENNAVTFDHEYYYGIHAKNVLVTFERDHSKLYAKLLMFCAENGGIVISTNPGTYATIVRVYC